jgi:hypothetical protein
MYQTRSLGEAITFDWSHPVSGHSRRSSLPTILGQRAVLPLGQFGRSHHKLISAPRQMLYQITRKRPGDNLWALTPVLPQAALNHRVQRTLYSARLQSLFIGCLLDLSYPRPVA